MKSMDLTHHLVSVFLAEVCDDIPCLGVQVCKRLIVTEQIASKRLLLFNCGLFETLLIFSLDQNGVQCGQQELAQQSPT
jgi:hypothetical protein